MVAKPKPKPKNPPYKKKALRMAKNQGRGSKIYNARPKDKRPRVGP